MADKDQILDGRRRAMGALAPDAWVGRHALLSRLHRRLRQHPRREPQAIALTGPEGAGKSELLRQAALAWSRPGAELTPILVDLERLRERFEARHGAALAVADPRAWDALTRDALAQLLVAVGRLDAEFLDRSDPGAALDARAPAIQAWERMRFLGEWLAWPEKAGPGAYEDFLRAAARLDLPRPAILIDGLGAMALDDARAWLRPLAQGARRAGCAVLLEAPARDLAGVDPWTAGGLEPVALEPLLPAAAIGLARALADARGVVLEPAGAAGACERLGRWPGWLRAWIEQMPMGPAGEPSRRVAEQAYVDLLDASPWSRRMAARLEASVPFDAREAALALALRAASEEVPLDAARVRQCLAASPEAAGQALAALAAMGLIEPAGPRWRGPRWRALTDWAWLRLEQGRQGGDPAAPRLALLARRMIEEFDGHADGHADGQVGGSAAGPLHDASAAGQAGPAGGSRFAGRATGSEFEPGPAAGVAARRLLPEILSSLAGQELPEALFRYPDYYEAVGRLDPAFRREAMFQAKQRLRAPESLGVAEGAASGPWPTFHAHVFRDGVYRAANEELWVAVDLSATRSLTTVEIEQALQVAKNEGRRQNAVFCRPWLIVGQTASPDAMELLQREKIFCSNQEQLGLMLDMLGERPGRRASTAPEESLAPAATPGMPRPGAVIDLPAQSLAPQADVSSLRLPARDQSEYIAASMAEKVAIRGGFGATDAGKIKTSVLEGVLNAIEHSHNAEKLIDIQFRLTRDAFEAWIENEGAPFAPDQDVPRPDPRAKLSAANKRGWGITLMRRFMDEVRYEPCLGGTRLCLVKRRAAGAFAASDEDAAIDDLAAVAASEPSFVPASNPPERPSLARHRKDKAQS